METVFWTILVLGVLVFVHELGHFIAAKAAGIQVPRFSIGLGPRLVGFRIGETDYCLSAVPFGGYVKMAGMEGEEALAALEGDPLLREAAPEDFAPENGRQVESGRPDEAADRGRDRSSVTAPRFDPARGFDAKPLPVRLIVILAGVFMNFVFGFVVFVLLSYSQGQPVLPTLVSSVAPELVKLDPQLAEWRGRSIRMVNGAPVDNWNELVDRLQEVPEGAPLVIGFADGSELKLAGSVSGAELARALLPGLPPVIGQVQEESPARAAGLRPGDRILALDGRPVRLWDEIPQYIRERAGRRVVLTIERDATPGAPGGEETREIAIVPRREQAPGEDSKFVPVGHLGVIARILNEPVSFPEALRSGTNATLRAGGLILGGLGQLVTGKVSLKSLGGPVAIGQITGYYQRQGLDQLLWWMGLFSINLAILNLLPIPVLDGGHVLFLAIEGVRGHPLTAQSKIRLSQAGMVMLILLMAWAVTSDVLRLFGL
jgi:regulator of sigma E protease